MGNKVQKCGYKYKTNLSPLFINTKTTKMKKSLTLLAVFACLAYTATAQKITYAVSAGVSYANTFIKVLDPEKKVEGLGSKGGFTGGISANIPFSRYFSFQPGVNFVQKGFKNEESKTTLSVNYIEVPLHVMFNTRNRDDNKKADEFFFAIGPSIAFGTNGKMEYRDDTVKFAEKIKFGNSDNDDLKRVDIGASVVMGCMFSNNIFFSVNYNVGLTDLSGIKDIRWRNNYAGFKVGYAFGGKRK